MFPVKQGDNQQTVYCLCLFVVWWFQIFFLVLLICPTGTNFCCRENKAFIFDSQRGVADRAKGAMHVEKKEPGVSGVPGVLEPGTWNFGLNITASTFLAVAP